MSRPKKVQDIEYVRLIQKTKKCTFKDIKIYLNDTKKIEIWDNTILRNLRALKQKGIIKRTKGKIYIVIATPSKIKKQKQSIKKIDKKIDTFLKQRAIVELKLFQKNKLMEEKNRNLFTKYMAKNMKFEFSDIFNAQFDMNDEKKKKLENLIFTAIYRNEREKIIQKFLKIESMDNIF